MSEKNFSGCEEMSHEACRGSGAWPRVMAVGVVRRGWNGDTRGMSSQEWLSLNSRDGKFWIVQLSGW